MSFGEGIMSSIINTVILIEIKYNKEDWPIIQLRGCLKTRLWFYCSLGMYCSADMFDSSLTFNCKCQLVDYNFTLIVVCFLHNSHLRLGFLQHVLGVVGFEKAEGFENENPAVEEAEKGEGVVELGAELEANGNAGCIAGNILPLKAAFICSNCVSPSLLSMLFDKSTKWVRLVYGTVSKFP
jgi:hypothetical protein